MPVHRILIERNQQVNSIAKAPHLFYTCPNRKEGMPATNDGLVSVVRIDVETTPNEDLREDISRCSHTLSCGSADRHNKSALHSWSPCSIERKSVPFETAASRIGRHRPRLIDSQGPALEVFAVYCGNSLVAPVLHLYKSKTLGAAGVAVGDDSNGLDRTRLAEQLLQIALRCFIGEIS